jgi:fatty-acyl-CoA synthase
MESRFVVKIARFDIDAELPIRGPDGRCVECAPNEVGATIGLIVNDPSKPAARFEGYADERASEAKIIRDVFEPGDAWFRSGDLMRKDELGYYYFVDRVGDTFRWKGENVSTNEVGEAVSSYHGVQEATVYGVGVPGMDGRAGMASVVVDPRAAFDLQGLPRFVAARLPEYARPLFYRFRDHLDMTATFKSRKADLVAEGFDPARVRDAVFFVDPKTLAMTPVDATLRDAICSGAVRL